MPRDRQRELAREPVREPKREPTIYQYRLVRKIAFQPEIGYSHLVAAVLCLAALIAVRGWNGLFGAVTGALLMTALHAAVAWLTLRRVDAAALRRWTFRTDWPWWGPFPVTDTSLRLFRKLHAHLALVGFCCAGLFYPWSPSVFVISLAYWHLWLLAPRAWLLWRLRREDGENVLRFGPGEVSVYRP